jgi:hypothetical protein
MKNYAKISNSKKTLIAYLAFVAVFITLFFLFMNDMNAQQNKYYNACARENAIYSQQVDDVSGESKKIKVESDVHGNAQGNQYDLAVDGAFQGQTIAVLHFYTGEGFDFSLPKAALQEKGFSVYRWIDNPPSPEELEKALKNACELWIISSNVQKLNEEHLKVIKKFFDSGKGVYIWGG